MDLSTAADFDWRDADARAQFLLLNGAAHTAITMQLQINGKTPTGYPLLDIADSHQGHQDWRFNHYLMHQQAADFLSLDCPPLADADFDDEASLSNWLQLHLEHHLELDQALSL